MRRAGVDGRASRESDLSIQTRHNQSRENTSGKDSEAARGTEGLVLCGGAGRRAGGRDKGLLKYAGEPMVSRVARILRPLCTRILISANRHREDYLRLSLGPVVGDRRPGFAGPLAGLEAVEARLRGARLLVLPCDLPLVDAAVVRRLLETLQAAPELDAVYARTADREHYLCAALQRRALASLPACLDRGQRSVRSWLATLHTRSELFTGAQAASLKNFNAGVDGDAHEQP